MKKVFLFGLLSIVAFSVQAQNINDNKFKQLKEELPGPNMYRSASGAPGPEYFQQQADYVIEVVLDDEKQTVKEINTKYSFDIGATFLDAESGFNVKVLRRDDA